MKKLIVGLCLMLMWSSSYGLNIWFYNVYRGAPEFPVNEYLTRVYHGLRAYNWLIQNRDLDFFCPPGMEFNGDNLKSIVDAELKASKYDETISVAYPLYDGLVKTFPCKQ